MKKIIATIENIRTKQPKINNLYLKYVKPYKQSIMYLAVGVPLTVFSFILYEICFHLTASATVSNIISTVIAVMLAYVSNKIWVFESKTHSFSELFKEWAKFVSGRAFTFITETLMLGLLVDIMGFDKTICKIVSSVVVIVLNYMISKKAVFNK